jgi:tetratricopeptide (TPR) repeat protein
MRFVAAAMSLIVCLAAPALAQQTREDREALRHLRLGQENLHAEHWDKAETEFKAAIKIDPFLELAHYGLGQAYMGMKRFPAAVNAFIECRTAFHGQEGKTAEARLRNEKRIADQIQQLQDQKAQMTSNNFKSGGTMQSGAVARLDSMITELQSRRFQDVSAPAPQTPPWISLALGSAYFRSGQIEDAEREYRETIRVDPKIGEAHNNLAVVCFQTGRVPEADAEIQAAEKAGFKVHPQLKEDVKKALARR